LSKLLRSKDRKVANLVTPNGKQASIANTFGLPAGKAFSCPGATSICEKVCYAGKLEKVFKGTRENLLHNWNLLKDATFDEMIILLDEMISEFEKECTRRNADKLFRIHWDGDFFNDTYTYAWQQVINNHPDIQFWVYTRVKDSAEILKDTPNLSLYFSTDNENREVAKDLSQSGIKLAYLADTFAIGREGMLELVNKSAVRCPENNKKIPLISTNGSACVSCGQCVFNRNDILFSASKK
jgi:ferredoxin